MDLGRLVWKEEESDGGLEGENTVSEKWNRSGLEMLCGNLVPLKLPGI